MRLAVVKSSVYQDLWVCNRTDDSLLIFLTTMLRCPPIGLSEQCSTDYIIVKECDEFPCQFNKNVLPPEMNETMKYSKHMKNPSLPFLDESFHGEITIDSVALDSYTLDWSVYDIVLCINTCIPNSVIQKYDKLLWCYWVGENDGHLLKDKIGNYNLILNQDATDFNIPEYSIGFPYSYIGPRTLEDLAERFGISHSVKEGIYMEINTTTERPVRSIPDEFQTISSALSIPINTHSQHVIQNLHTIVRSKYFVKLMGRIIRGNSILESISAGTLVLANRNLVMYKEFITDGCHVETIFDVISKIEYYERNPLEYTSALNIQKGILKEMFFEVPMQRLLEKYRLHCESRSS